MESTITVRGEGSVSVTPDVVQVALTVFARAGESMEAYERVRAMTERLLAEVKDQEIAPADIRSRGLRLEPHMRQTDGDWVPDGWQGFHRLQVTARDIERAGTLLDTLTGALGESLQIEGIRFAVAQPEALLAQARLRAADDARARATALAERLGRGLGPALRIEDQRSSFPRPEPMAFAIRRDAPVVPMQMAPGEEDISAAVTVTFALVDAPA